MLRDEFVWVEREGTQIHYAPTDDPSPPRAAATWRSSRPTTRPCLRALTEAGFELTEGANAWDAPRTFVRDPGGHRVEIMSAPPHPPWPGE